ncbi:hypothetical protein NQ317_017103 [Molorchus minor]|uniref:Uncharacterized protein n=1 Tax=Molorchus minor TaxID=1323400 RepID=A0ABQ9JPF1_9CUCU|nr:hypothetical protein NQ317_017103 [Molorchus minor]
MDRPRPCGCKGRRSCLICEEEYALNNQSNFINKENNTYVYCPYCNKAWPGWNIYDYKIHPNHEGSPIVYPGVYVDLNFLSKCEEKYLMDNIDSMPWSPSQSGRRKQNFGPKCNLKKRKLNIGEFNGFPQFSQFIQKKFISVPILDGFQTIEQCSLEYNPDRGASIDPHIDDCWVWGERIVTVNLLADAVLTMTINSKHERYNLDCVKTYPSVLDSNGNKNTTGESYCLKSNEKDVSVIRIPMPRKSLLVMYGSARYDWEHQVLREDILERRVCLAYREFTPPYLKHGEKYEEAREILIRAKRFCDIKDFTS